MPDKVYWSLVGAARISPAERSDFLSPVELRNLSKLRFPKRRREWLLGRWTAKSLVQSLPAYRHYSLDQIEIHNTPEGAPHIKLPEGNVSPGCLSLSHRDSLAFCAFTTGSDLKIGADLEKTEPRAGNFAADYFTEAERMLIDSHPENARMTMTTLIWSVKESMLKALGIGLHWDTRRVEISEIKGLGAPSGEWREIRVFTRSNELNWSAWWRYHGYYILTLVGCKTERPDLLFMEQKL